jgi:hypothetical protein
MQTEIKSIVNRLRQLKVSKINLLKNEVIINGNKINLGQKGGFLSESSSDLFSETSVINQNGGNMTELDESETPSFVQNDANMFSETSENMNEILDNQIYSATSSVVQNGGNLFSETSEIMSERVNNKIYSETSGVNFSFKHNLSETSIFKKNSDIYSQTSDLKSLLKGGYTEMDTLHSISELEESNLDLDIFRRSMKSQKGGSINFNNKETLNQIGINSSSTSSVCE